MEATGVVTVLYDVEAPSCYKRAVAAEVVVVVVREAMLWVVPGAARTV